MSGFRSKYQSDFRRSTRRKENMNSEQKPNQFINEDGAVKDEGKAHAMAIKEHRVRDRADAVKNDELKKEIIKGAEDAGDKEGALIDIIHEVANIKIKEALLNGRSTCNTRDITGLGYGQLNEVRNEINKILDSGDYDRSRFTVTIDQRGSTGEGLIIEVENTSKL